MADEHSTLKSCAKCGKDKPATDFSRGRSCKLCLALAAKSYRQRNPEKQRQAKHKWEKKNPEKVKAQSRRDYAKRKDAILTYWHAYYSAHKEQYLLLVKKYRQTHREERRVYSQNRNARKAELPATLTKEEAAFCRQYFHYACAACGNEEGFQWTISLDHWTPLKSTDCPGTVATNMIPLCHGMGGCNTTKKATLPEQWLLKRFGKHKASKILKRINAYQPRFQCSS
jgi:hypothetical protein